MTKKQKSKKTTATGQVESHSRDQASAPLANVLVINIINRTVFHHSGRIEPNEVAEVSSMDATTLIKLKLVEKVRVKTQGTDDV